MAKKLKFVKIFTCPMCWCVHYVVVRWKVCEHPEDRHIDRNM
jgi:hypothetical protein